MLIQASASDLKSCFALDWTMLPYLLGVGEKDTTQSGKIELPPRLHVYFSSFLDKEKIILSMFL